MAGQPRRLLRNINAKIAALPMVLTTLVVFVGGTIWTVVYSFTDSKLLPRLNWVGLEQYERLWSNSRWLVSIENLMFYGVLSLVFTISMGFLLAVLMDQKIRYEDTFRTIMLYPFALSFIVTGLVWQWILNPEFGIQGIVRGWGWESFAFDPLNNPDTVLYGLLIAGLWQGTGFVMCLMLAGLRGIDEDIWKAARVDGIPTWKTYLVVIVPMMRPVLATFTDCICDGRMVMISAAHIGNATSPSDSIGWPNAVTCRPWTRDTVPVPASVMSPVARATETASPGCRVVLLL